jgi:hypothetical protein
MGGEYNRGKGEGMEGEGRGEEGGKRERKGWTPRGPGPPKIFGLEPPLKAYSYMFLDNAWETFHCYLALRRKILAQLKSEKAELRLKVAKTDERRGQGR